MVLLRTFGFPLVPGKVVIQSWLQSSTILHLTVHQGTKVEMVRGSGKHLNSEHYTPAVHDRQSRLILVAVRITANIILTNSQVTVIMIQSNEMIL
jgi:hypothetical protein